MSLQLPCSQWQHSRNKSSSVSVTGNSSSGLCQWQAIPCSPPAIPAQGCVSVTGNSSLNLCYSSSGRKEQPQASCTSHVISCFMPLSFTNQRYLNCQFIFFINQYHTMHFLFIFLSFQSHLGKEKSHVSSLTQTKKTSPCAFSKGRRTWLVTTPLHTQATPRARQAGPRRSNAFLHYNKKHVFFPSPASRHLGDNPVSLPLG